MPLDDMDYRSTKLTTAKVWEGDANNRPAEVDPDGQFTPAAHEATHVKGGADDIDSALDARAIALANQGDIPYHAAAANTLAALAPGVAGQALLSGGAAANPTFGAPAPAAHVSTHEAGGTDPMRWTNVKLLLGAGAGADPTEIDVPGGATKEIFVHPISGNPMPAPSATNEHGVVVLDAGAEYANFNFKAPHDFSAITNAEVILFGGGTDRDIDWTCNTDFGAVGEDWDIHTDTATADGVTISVNILYGIDVSAALTGLAADDYVGMKFILDAITTGGVSVIGFLFKYS